MNKNEKKRDSFTENTIWLTIGSVFSRIIGALYVIPWAGWFGETYTTANTLLSVGYKPYVLFTAIATAGFPSAIAKQIAFHNSKKDYETADAIYKNSSLLMLLMGIFFSILLYIMAPGLAYQSPSSNPEGAIKVIRSLAPAVLVLPNMSLLRGYFQGQDDMKPTAISQLLEQLIRVVYMLIATYIIMVKQDGDVVIAVVHSTFAAFIGALISLIYLLILYLWRKRKINACENKINTIKNKKQEKSKLLLSIKLLFQDSIPFVIIGSGIAIFQLIDTYSFGQIMRLTTNALTFEISELYGAFSLDVDKLTMIIISLAVSVASAAIPSIVTSYATQNRLLTGNLIIKVMSLFLCIMIPASIGLASVSDYMYKFFYPTGHISGPDLLRTASIVSIVLGVYTVLSSVLQSMSFHSYAIKSLLIGLLVKILTQFPLVAFFHAQGALVSSALGFFISSFMMWKKINYELNIDINILKENILKIILSSIIMGISCWQWTRVFNLIFIEQGRLYLLCKLTIIVLIGVSVYFSMLILLGGMNIIFSEGKQERQNGKDK